jgi:hypothetical protein
LQQAQLRKKGAFAQEFRVDADRCLGFELRASAELSSRSIQIASGIAWIRVYNLSKVNKLRIMTELTMLRLAKAFWDLALWRMSPAQLPASVFCWRWWPRSSR